MLVNIKEMTERALHENYAIPQFNINNLEWTRFILETCEEMKTPVILGVSEVASKYMGGFKTIVNLVNGLIEDLNITIPVCLHIDHGTSFEICKKAIDAGFTSVMIDASKYSLEENIKITKLVVEYAKNYNVTVEAEIGHIGKSENDTLNEVFYASVDDVKRLVHETNIDLVAPALGSIHGMYKGEPKLDFDKMKEISNLVKIPLVLHGGTGIYDEQIKTAINCGVAKININTELQIAWSKSVRNFINSNIDEYDPRKIISSGKKAIQDKIREKILLFGSNNKY